MKNIDILSFKLDDVVSLKNFITCKIYNYSHKDEIKKQCQVCTNECNKLISEINNLLEKLDKTYSYKTTNNE